MPDGDVELTDGYDMPAGFGTAPGPTGRQHAYVYEDSAGTGAGAYGVQVHARGGR